MAERKSWKGKARGKTSDSGEEKVDRYSAHVEATNAKIIELMEEKKAPWQMPWEPGQPGGGMPYNATTGKAYSGYNAMALRAEGMIKGYTDNRWLTFNQAKQLGAHVRKGEKGTQAVKYVEVKDKRERRGEGPTDEEDTRRSRLMGVVFTVFNAEQIEGLPPAPQQRVRTEVERHAECDRLIEDSKANIIHGGDHAYYSSNRDTIHLPEREQFRSDDAYYAVALHELGHWTGHPSRLGRDMSDKFGTPGYAKEELRAEIASLMIGQRLGIGHDPSRHAAYVKGWVEVIQDDPKAILHACRDAEKICDFLGVEKYEYEATQKAEATNEDKAEQASTAKLEAVPSATAAQASNDDAPAAAEHKRVAQRRASYGMSM